MLTQTEIEFQADIVWEALHGGGWDTVEDWLSFRGWVFPNTFTPEDKTAIHLELMKPLGRSKK